MEEGGNVLRTTPDICHKVSLKHIIADLSNILSNERHTFKVCNSLSESSKLAKLSTA